MIPDFPHNIRIRLTLSLTCWLSQFSFSKLRQPTGQILCNVRVQQKKIQLGQSYSYIMRKVWHHQVWIQHYVGFIVLILNCTGKVDWWWCIMNEKLLHLISTTRSAKDHHHILISNLFSGAQCCWCNRQFTTVLKNGKFIGQRSPSDCHHRWYIFQIL